MWCIPDKEKWDILATLPSILSLLPGTGTCPCPQQAVPKPIASTADDQFKSI